MRKVKIALVWGLVCYTVLVTCFLIQAVWEEDDAVQRRSRTDDRLIKVLFQEERRHLRSFNDVIKTYGGVVRRKIRKTLYEITEDGANPIAAPPDGEDGNALKVPDNSSQNGGIDDFVEAGANGDTGNIIIEEVDRSLRNLSTVNETRKHGKLPATSVSNEQIEINAPETLRSKNSLTAYSSKLNVSKLVLNQNEQVIHTSLTKVETNKNSKKDSQRKTTWTIPNKPDSQYCASTVRDEPHLCLSELITYAHPSHVNISSTHMSFKPLGDLFIYSGFFDNRGNSASLRFMVLAPQGRHSVNTSGFWCSFALPIVPPKNYFWNGKRDSVTFSPNQATQLDYYAASAGHGKRLQFYIMSCAVPSKHLSSFLESDSVRIHLVAGTATSPFLVAVQERVAIYVLNNLATPRNSFSAFKSDVNNSNAHNRRNILSVDANRKKLSRHFISEWGTNKTSLVNNVHSFNHSSIRVKRKKRDISYANAVQQPTNERPRGIVSCVAPIVAHVSVLHVVQFIELSLLLGSQHIVLYTHKLSDDLSDLLSMYRSQGLITVLPWPIPNADSTWANGRDFALNDCLYRVMHKYEFAVFHNMNEFIVPRLTPDLPSFINFLKSKAGFKTNTTDIVFSSAFFPPPTEEQIKSLQSTSGYSKNAGKLSTLRSVHRTFFSSDHTIRILVPRLTFRVGAGERRRTSFVISKRYAAANSYARCPEGSNPTSRPAATRKHSVGTIDDSDTQGSISRSGAAENGTQKDSVHVPCKSSKLDMHLWLLKDRLLERCKNSMHQWNNKKKER